MLFFLLVSLAAASGPPVDLDAAQQAACIPNDGYLPYPAPAGDCCKFIVCDNANANKTGFVGTCMGGTAWNDGLKVCDDPKYVSGCNPAADCQVPKRTNEVGGCASLGAGQCCYGGREPVYTAVSGTPNQYTVDGYRGVNTCPLGEVFNLADCCCEQDLVEICSPGAYSSDPNSVNDLGEADPDSCCGFRRCWSNGTGYDVFKCMPPSVYNPARSVCDMPNNVMACMNFFCGEDVNDEVCVPPGPEAGSCCIDGIWYNGADGGNTYVISRVDYDHEWQEDGRVLCCGEGQVWNNADCCCEAAPEVP